MLKRYVSVPSLLRRFILSVISLPLR
jgi:hypothetical protein